MLGRRVRKSGITSFWQAEETNTLGGLTRSRRGCDWRVCWWRDKAIKYCADHVMRQAPSHARCLKDPTRFSPSKPLTRPFFRPSAGYLRILFASPVKAPNLGHFLVRMTAFILGADARKPGHNLYIAARAREEKPGSDDPIFRFYLVLRFRPVGRFMHDEMGAHAQDATGCLFP